MSRAVDYRDAGVRNERAHLNLIAQPRDRASRRRQDQSRHLDLREQRARIRAVQSLRDTLQYVCRSLRYFVEDPFCVSGAVAADHSLFHEQTSPVTRSVVRERVRN